MRNIFDFVMMINAPCGSFNTILSFGGHSKCEDDTMENDADFLYQIRDLMINDLDQYNALLCYAFQVTEQQLMRVG